MMTGVGTVEGLSGLEGAVESLAPAALTVARAFAAGATLVARAAIATGGTTPIASAWELTTSRGTGGGSMPWAS